jgi:hypothetical protein
MAWTVGGKLEEFQDKHACDIYISRFPGSNLWYIQFVFGEEGKTVNYQHPSQVRCQIEGLKYVKNLVDAGVITQVVEGKNPSEGEVPDGKPGGGVRGG